MESQVKPIQDKQIWAPPIQSPADYDEGEIEGGLTAEKAPASNRPAAVQESMRMLSELAQMSGMADTPQPNFGTRKPIGFKESSEAGKKHLNNFVAQEKINRQSLAAVKFGDDIKTLLISSVDLRIISYFLGVHSVNDIKSAPHGNVTLLAFLTFQCIPEFMANKGYSFAGELMFNDDGSPCPVSKNAWNVGGEEITFTKKGYIYFESPSGNRKDNIVFFVFSRNGEPHAGLSCYSTNEKTSKKILTELEQFTRKNNCLRGKKIRDVNVLAGEFVEVTQAEYEKVTWENYYYEPHIKDLLELEVFGFLKNTERYNLRNITKRGVLCYGPAGSGKTSLGRIICNYAQDYTIIWITPDLIAENEAGKFSIKLLYTLADFVSPVCIILEDIDLFARDREDGASNDLRLGALMNILDGVNSVKNAVTVAMTNRMEIIEHALRNRPGRFDRVVEIPTLNDELRTRMLTDRMVPFKVDKGVIEHIVKKSKNWTGADVQEIVHSLNMHFIHNNLEHDQHVTMELCDKILGTMQKYNVDEKKKKKNLGFGGNREE